MKQKGRATLALLLALCMTLGLYPGGGLPAASAVVSTAEVEYLDFNADGTPNGTKTRRGFNVVDANTAKWDSDFYVVTSDVTITERIIGFE